MKHGHHQPSTGRRADEVLPLIPLDKIRGMVGKPIHLSWAGVGCVWILEKIDGRTMHLRTPKTRKQRTAPITEAVYTRGHVPEGTHVDYAGETKTAFTTCWWGRCGSCPIGAAQGVHCHARLPSQAEYQRRLDKGTAPYGSNPCESYGPGRDDQ